MSPASQSGTVQYCTKQGPYCTKHGQKHGPCFVQYRTNKSTGPGTCPGFEQKSAPTGSPSKVLSILLESGTISGLPVWSQGSQAAVPPHRTRQTRFYNSAKRAASLHNAVCLAGAECSWKRTHNWAGSRPSYYAHQTKDRRTSLMRHDDLRAYTLALQPLDLHESFKKPCTRRTVIAPDPNHQNGTHSEKPWTNRVEP